MKAIVISLVSLAGLYVSSAGINRAKNADGWYDYGN